MLKMLISLKEREIETETEIKIRTSHRTRVNHLSIRRVHNNKTNKSNKNKIIINKLKRCNRLKDKITHKTAKVTLIINFRIDSNKESPSQSLHPRRKVSLEPQTIGLMTMSLRSSSQLI